MSKFIIFASIVGYGKALKGFAPCNNKNFDLSKGVDVS
jgi:hypothetical protein